MSSPVILIAGPTASGKSGLALALAERLGGAVINADSMQVYRNLRILTARPSAEDEARAPHVLYGHVDGAEAYSAGRFQREAQAAIADVEARGLIPIVVGGTGLYFKTLTDGLSAIPVIPEAVRAFWRGEALRCGAMALYGELQRRDAAMAARLAPTDTQRITRALEVIEATGRSLSEWQALPGTPVLGPLTRTVRLVVMPEREEMRQRCDARFDVMMGAGALDEVAELAGQGLDPTLPLMRALGVRPLLQLVRGDVRREEAVLAAKAETRQFAKRQVTWLKSNMIAWEHVPAQEMEYCMPKIMTFICPKP